MKLEKIDMGETGQFSPIFLDYISENANLKDFYTYFPRIDNFLSQIKLKSEAKINRSLLAEALSNQYQNLATSDAVTENIKSLNNNTTYTVTTGHQLNIFTGPIYFIYKIVTVIKTCILLKKQYPEYNFIPVFWMASEDHDFEEINNFNLFGKNYKWETDQKGPVGRFSPKSLERLLNELPEKVEVFEKAYLTHETLSGATRFFVNELFGKYGLVIVDGDDSSLKSEFRKIVKEEVLGQKGKPLVEEFSNRLSEKGYNSQAFAREINLFYLDNNIRERIIRENGSFKVLNTEISFSEEEFFKLLEQSPEKISPNVIFRPLYQETILPNLAYVGGPAEVAYWLQLKGLFDHFNIALPILMPRIFGLIINKTFCKKINKLNLNYRDLFFTITDLKNNFIKQNAEQELSLENEKWVLEQIFESIKHAVKVADPTLEGLVAGELKKALGGIENIERKLKKVEEQKQETSIKQLENIKEKLFPDNGLQERKDNFLNFYLNNPSLLDYLIDNFDPFDFRFNLILEDE